MIAEKIQKGIGKVSATLGSLLKVAVMSRTPSKKSEKKPQRPLVIMGNGPSLRRTIDEHGDWLRSCDLMAVNFAANTPDFFQLRPTLYILADGHFFSGRTTDPNVERLWERLSMVDWEMTLWVAAPMTRLAESLTADNPHITVRHFNLTPLEGSERVCGWLMDAGMGMPRPRNVMIPAIMTAIREGYSTIYLCGADHTWTQTLSVDDENFVVSVQPHFYEDNPKEHERVRATYAGLRLHDVLGSMTIAFRSYWEIRRYADRRGIRILNATPGSMIDAFPRHHPEISK